MTNKLNRKKTRKLLFQELYAQTYNHFDKELFYDSFIKEVFSFSIDEKYLAEMLKIIHFHEKTFIAVIKKYSPRFSIETMSLSYVLPVYIWLAEMLYLSEEIPGKVSINEAVEIAKVYWDDSSKKIVNWILNKVLENLNSTKEFAREISTEDMKISTIFVNKSVL